MTSFGAVHLRNIGHAVVFDFFLAFGSLRVGMCVFVTFKLGVFLSLMSDVCHAIFLSVWQGKVL